MQISATVAGDVRWSAPVFTQSRNITPSIRQDPVIKIVRHPTADIWLPVFAGEYTASECMGRETYLIDGKEYADCDFCRAACPARDRFKEPDSGLPLRCDMCENDPPLEVPKCVEWCISDVLTYEGSGRGSRGERGDGGCGVRVGSHGGQIRLG